MILEEKTNISFVVIKQKMYRMILWVLKVQKKAKPVLSDGEKYRAFIQKVK